MFLIWVSVVLLWVCLVQMWLREQAQLCIAIKGTSDKGGWSRTGWTKSCEFYVG